MTRLAGIDVAAPPEVVLPLFLLLLLGLSGLLGRLAGHLAARWLGGGQTGDAGRRTPPPALGVPVGAALFMGGVLLVIPELALPARLARWITVPLYIGLVCACALAVSRIALAAANEYAARNAALSPALGVTRAAVRILVVVLALITTLQILGVPVAPLLTTFGVGSLAVALALQETLANFFAGLYLIADRPVRAGDFVKIHDGEEGYVETIGWRSSRLRTVRNNVVIVPNRTLSQAILTNFHLPVSAVGITVGITVEGGADPLAVEQALLAAATEAVREAPELREGKPIVRFADLTELGQLWHVTVEVRDVDAQKAGGHEIRKRLLARLRKDGIAVAFKPISNDGAPAKTDQAKAAETTAQR